MGPCDKVSTPYLNTIWQVYGELTANKSETDGSGIMTASFQVWRHDQFLFLGY